MRRKNLIPTAIFAACLMIAGTAFGATFEIPDKASRDGDLRVVGPRGFELNQSFKAGETVSISLFDKAGYHLADGSYNWEMTYKRVADGDRDGFHARAEPASGAFTVRDGAVVGKNAIEGGFNKDQVILDDLIVDGSICAGMDCVNGESFGFDTIRMKENNLRLRAVDTSSTSSFPTRDWQITFNDSSNGGANKFSIDDIDGGRTPFTIEAGAPSHSLYVDDGGRIGFGTSTPVADLHVKSGNTPSLRLEQDGSSGFTAQTWDLAGNEANLFIRDATNGSTLPFRLRPGAPTSSIDIADDGDVGMGTASPESGLHVVRSVAANLRLEAPNLGIVLNESDETDSNIQQFLNNSRFRIRGIDDSNGETNAGISFDVAGTTVGVNCNDGAAPVAGANLVVGSGGGCATAPYTYTVAGSGDVNSSSRSYKENLQSIEAENILDKIAGIEVYTYDFISGPKDALGLMAEDFHQVFGRGSDKTISSQEVQMAMWLAIQELTGQVEELKAELAVAQAE